MSSRHSIGPWTSDGTWARVPALSPWPAERGMRGSGPSTVDGGGQGRDDSHWRRYRTSGSCAVAVDERRRNALSRAVAASAPHWSDAERATVAALLDVLWNVPSYERLVSVWKLAGDDATRAITWVIAKLVQAIEDDEPPPTR